jgi:hypothetical protein
VVAVLVVSDQQTTLDLELLLLVEVVELRENLMCLVDLVVQES